MLKVDKFNDDISLGDSTTIRGEISDMSAFVKFDPVQDNPLDVRRNKWRIKDSVQKARAVVFDVLYGTGAHLKALIFLNHYKIPKKFYSDGESSTEDDSMTSTSDINDEITSPGDDPYGSNSTFHFTEKRNFFNGEVNQIDGCNIEVANNEFMIDILVITAEDEDLPLPPP